MCSKSLSSIIELLGLPEVLDDYVAVALEWMCPNNCN